MTKNAHVISAEEAVALVKPGDWFEFGAGFNQPDVFDRALAARQETLRDVRIRNQAASESDGHRHISGTGGQAQFVRGAYASKGGKSFICLASTHERKGVRKSRIVLNLTAGNVVTEYGIANLKGLSVAERARAIIGLAHPDDREELSREARDHGLVPRHFL